MSDFPEPQVFALVPKRRWDRGVGECDGGGDTVHLGSVERNGLDLGEEEGELPLQVDG